MKYDGDMSIFDERVRTCCFIEQLYIAAYRQFVIVAIELLNSLVGIAIHSVPIICLSLCISAAGVAYSNPLSNWPDFFLFA